MATFVRRDLPCYPCPHASACCAYGVSLTDAEKVQVVAKFGEKAVVFDDAEQEWRTRVVEGRCFFSKDNVCTIHAESFYPETCRGFPWVLPSGEPYPYDVTICPELGEDKR